MLIYSEMERNNITRDAVNNLHKTIAGLEGRKYAPRKLLNLFTKGEYI